MVSVILLVKTQSMNSPSSNMSSNAFRFACPGSHHVSNGSGSSAVSFADVFQNEAIWGSAVQASVTLNQHHREFRDLNGPLHNNLHRGLVD